MSSPKKSKAKTVKTKTKTIKAKTVKSEYKGVCVICQDDLINEDPK